MCLMVAFLVFLVFDSGATCIHVAVLSCFCAFLFSCRYNLLGHEVIPLRSRLFVFGNSSLQKLDGSRLLSKQQQPPDPRTPLPPGTVLPHSAPQRWGSCLWTMHQFICHTLGCPHTRLRTALPTASIQSVDATLVRNSGSSAALLASAKPIA